MHKRKPATEHPDLQAIWNHMYVVKMPEMYLRAEEDIRARGTITTGNAEQDMAVQNSYVRAYRTINQIFELWKAGVPVAIVKYEDTEKIYRAIEKHLSTWHKYLQYGVAIGSCPFDDLLELDRFANTVYDRAKYVFTQDSLVPIQAALNSLGMSMNPLDYRFSKSNNRIRFTHAFKTEAEIMAEQGVSYHSYAERRGYEEELTVLASRYDIRTKPSYQEDKPLSIELTFKNKNG